MRNIIIAILLLTALTAQSQTKWRQIERSLTKWNVPAAYDSIPGQAGYAGKWIDLATLLDTLGLDTIGGSGISGSGVADRVTIWSGVNSLTSNANFTFTGGNTVNIIGRMIMQATATAGNWNAFINGGNTTLTGTKNIAIGSNQTLSSLTTGNSNLAFGTLAGYKTTTGSENVFLGYLTGSENTTGNSNMYIGSGSGYLNNGDYNTFIGSNTGRNCLTTLGNIFLGYNTGYNATNNYNIGIGYYNSFNTSNSGTENVIIGTQASQNGGGNYNVKIGTQSGYANTGSNNVFIGQESGFSTSSKGGNIFIGYESGRNEDIDNSLIIANSASTSNGIYGDYDNAKFGVNIAPASAARAWDINGELRVRDLTTDNPTRLIGADNDGDINSVTIGSGLSITGSTLNVSSFIDSTIVTQGFGILVNESPLNTFTVRADTSKIATQFDISQLDQSATNEIQTLATSGAAGNISISDGNTITLNVNDADANPTNELQKIDTFQIFDTNKLRISLQNDAEAAKVVILPNTIDSTNVTQGYGIIVAESPANTFTVRSDTTKIATLYDVSIVDQSATNEIQNISTNGTAGNVTISSGSTLTLNVNDADASITNEIQTIDTFQVFDTNKLRISLSNDGQAAKVVTLPTSGGGGGIDSTIVTAGWGVDVTESPLNTFTVKADTAEVATQYDLTLKQDKLVSGTNIKTVNSNSLLGSGNVSVGTVTSIGTSTPISGGTITGSGTIGLNYDTGTLTLSGSNLAARAGAAIWNASQLQNNTIISPLNPSIGNVLTYTASNQWEAQAPAGTNLTFTGSASPYTLNSSTGSDVTIAAGSGISLTRSTNELTIASTVTNPETWADVAGDIISWGSTGTFNSGKQVGIGTLNAARLLDVNGDAQLRGALYSSSSSAGSSGQVLTSNGTSAWSWATPADGSATNEIQNISTNGTAGNISISSGSTLTLNVNDADASTTNELQTLSHTSDVTTHTTTLSNSGGSLILAEGSGISLTTSSNQVTIAATASATDLSFTGTASPITLNSSSGTDVTLTAGSGISLTATSGNTTITASDASATNELQTLTNTSDATSHTLTLSNSGGSLVIVEGNGISLTTASNNLQISSSLKTGVSDLFIQSDLTNSSLTTTAVKFNFASGLASIGSLAFDTANDRITNNATGNTYLRITYAGSFDLSDLRDIDFLIYKNGSPIGYLSNLIISGDTTTKGFSKSFILLSAQNDYFELFYKINSGAALSIDFKNVTFNIEIMN